MKYRPDIDGLRALAVIAVLLFHVELPACPGGYLGVDVFFVISGFLITRLVHDAVQDGRFRFADFYLRRLRRLFPALLATCVLTAAACTLLLSRPHLKRCGEALLYSVLSLSNVYFWSESGYFGEQASVTPLLHTWSLGVEEQFYLLWPALIWLLARQRPRRALLLVLGVALISFAAFMLGAQLDEDAAFYLTPFRIWEFALGAALVWTRQLRLAARAQETLTLAGLALIVVPVLSFSAATFVLHPASLVLPCLGTACVILAGNAPVSGALLRNPAAVWLGRVSYSLYLVHWPVTVLYRYRRFEALRADDRLAVIALSLALALALYHAVEAPLRHPRRGAPAMSRARFVTACAALVLALAGFGRVLTLTGGWERPMERENAAILTYLRDQKRAIEQRAGLGRCYLVRDGTLDTRACLAHDPERANVLIAGDSYAATVFAALSQRSVARVHFDLLAVASCRPLRTFTSSLGACRQRNELLFERVDLTRYELVVLVGAVDADQAALLREAVASLRTRGARELVVVGSPHSYAEPVSTLFERFGATKTRAALMAKIRAQVTAKYLLADRALKAAKLDARYLSMIDVLCPSGRAQDCAHTLPGSDRPLIFDHGHITLDGADWVLSQLDARGSPFVRWRSYAARTP